MKRKRLIAAALSAVLVMLSGCAGTAAGASISDAEPEELSALASNVSGFEDVPENAWYAEAVNWCRENGLTDGGNAFSPDAVMSRSMVAVALYRAAGSPSARAASFSDIPSGAAYGVAAGWAADNGIIGGYGDGRFGPDAPVTRQQFAAILWRFAGTPEAPAGEDYADEAQIAAYAQTAVDWAREIGVILGKSDNRFDPYGGATRAQAAAILFRYLTREETVSGDGVSADGANETQPEEIRVKITVGDTELTAVLEDNSTVRELLSQMPMTLPMMDLYGREMCYRYGAYALPTDSLRSDRYEVGDIVYWPPGGSLVILYKQNGEQFERQQIGHIESGVEIFETTGDADVTFALYQN